MFVAIVLAALQQQPAPPPPPAPPKPPASVIARAEIQPAEAAVLVGDTLRLQAVGYDEGGRVVPAKVSWFAAGGFFEGSVDSTGLVTGGATGTITVTAMIRPNSGGRPTTAFGRVTILPQPASRLVVAPAISRLYLGQSVALEATPYAANDDRRYDEVRWTSDKPAVVAVTPDGRVTGKAGGQATLTATAGRATWRQAVTVVPNPVTQVSVEPASAEARTGDVVPLRFVAKAGTRVLGDARPEWSVSAGGGAMTDAGFVASEAGTYRVYATFAGRTAEAVITARPRDVRRPTTLVGRLPLKYSAAEFWLHPDGKHGYITTIADRAYAIDVSDPGKPFITDSVVVDARTINDLMTTEDGKYGVLTREGASNRKNGIVVLSFEDPAHPRQIAEFTETVTGGVHSTYIYKGYVYLTDDATGSMRVIDIRDPYKPRQVARWETPRPSAGRTLHDIDVKDGLAYLSYWNDGLVILDVGNGVKGGSPENPVLVSQTKYDLNALYREVEAVGGPGFIRGTHTAWRAGKYVFVGDEVFSAKPRPTEGGGVIGLGRAYGRLHVVDVSDLAHPRIVAHYEPKDGGTHNVWVAGDTLYLGDYQGGLRVLDISGELRGDLLQQGREIAHVVTGDKAGFVPNAANAWGAIYRDGYIYVPDINSGLWIVKVDSKSELTP
ncbi:MAG TPA: Ig-like domain-containing protein [Gemmatimonadales bacterium]|nr:Ig-like domain-containing protein [Gemmatimonadales bacterium]